MTDATAELERVVTEATDALNRALTHPAMAREPYRYILGAQVATLAALLQAGRTAQAVGTPVPDAVLERMVEAAHRGGAEALKREAGRLVRSADGMRATLVGCIAAGFFVAGIAVGVLVLLRLQGG